MSNIIFELQPPLRPSDSQIRQALQALGYPSPQPNSAPLVVGLANRESISGQYDDVLGAMYADKSLFFQGTTDPGRLPALGRGRIETHSNGVARLLPGYYRDYFRFGYHHHKRNHPCLRQASPAPFERYNRKNRVWVAQDPDNRALHLHRAGWDVEPDGVNAVPSKIGDYSHGCAVIPDRYEHWALMEFVGWDATQTDTRLDYALIDWPAYLLTQEE